MIPQVAGWDIITKMGIFFTCSILLAHSAQVIILSAYLSGLNFLLLILQLYQCVKGSIFLLCYSDSPLTQHTHIMSSRHGWVCGMDVAYFYLFFNFVLLYPCRTLHSNPCPQIITLESE